MVIVTKGNDPCETTRRALQKLSFPSLNGKKILIKPNAARLASPGQGVTTQPKVVRAIIEHLKQLGGQEIIIGESCIFGVDAQEAFRVTGMKEISEREGVQLIDLDRTDAVELVVPDGKLIQKIKVSAIVKEADVVISVPVMKTHMHTRVTLSIKNMKGSLWRKEKARFHHLRFDEEMTRGHKELDIGISEMASVLFPHFAVIDGTCGMEGMGPAYGRPKGMGLIVAGDNALSVDAVAARLMGLAPETIPHLALSAGRGLGEIDLRNISVEPGDYLKWEDPFDPPPSKLSIAFPDVIVHDEGSCSACLSTLVVFLQNYLPHLTDHRLEDGKIHLGLGRYLKTCPKGSILIGNCTARLKKDRRFVQGCPPIGSQILEVLRQQGVGNRKKV